MAVWRGDMGCLGTGGPPLAAGRGRLGGLGTRGPPLAFGLGGLGTGGPSLAGGLGTGAPPLAGLGEGRLAASGGLVGRGSRGPAVGGAALRLGGTGGQQQVWVVVEAGEGRRRWSRYSLWAYVCVTVDVCE